MSGIEHLPLFIAAGLLLNLTPGPDVLYIVTHALRQVGVELAGTLTRGMTVVDQRVAPGVDDPEGTVWHGHTLDPAAARAALLEAVTALSRPTA